MTVQITRLAHAADALRQHAARATDARVARRLFALALVLEGHGRAAAAANGGMDRQTLRDWVIRYNAQRIEGLSDRPHGSGPPAKLTDEEKTQLVNGLRRGPDFAEDGVIRWRLSDLRKRLFARMVVMLDERSVGRLVAALGFRPVAVRPRNPKAHEDDQAAHKNVWAAASASDFSDSIEAGCVNVSGLWAEPRPRWRSARPGPRKLHGVERHF
jgi:transposase